MNLRWQIRLRMQDHLWPSSSFHWAGQVTRVARGFMCPEAGCARP